MFDFLIAGLHMFELGKLYDCANTRLSGRKQDWNGFAKDFGAIFHSKMVLYRLAHEANRLDLLSKDELVATTDQELMAQYFVEKIYEYDCFFPYPPSPFESLRRTDVMDDNEFRKNEIAVRFLLPNNMFFIMTVFVALPDGSFLVLFVWRNEQGEGFSSIEKQRLVLFMHYLAIFFEMPIPAFAHGLDAELKDFGKKYSLTGAEMHILSALLEGQSLKFIAEDSARSYGTVRWHMQNILGKCQVKSQKNLLREFYRLIKS